MFVASFIYVLVVIYRLTVGLFYVVASFYFCLGRHLRSQFDYS